MDRWAIVAALLLPCCRTGEPVPPHVQEPAPTALEAEKPDAQELPLGEAVEEDDVAEDDDAQQPVDDGAREAMELNGPLGELTELFDESTEVQSLPPGGPYEAVKVVSTQWGSPAPGDMMNTSYSLAVRTQKGWYVKMYLGTDGILCGGDSLFSVGFSPGTLEYADVIPGEPSEILVTFEEWSDSSRSQQILVCSVGPSGDPTCSGPWIMSHEGAKPCCPWESRVEFTAEGQMKIVKDGELLAGPYTLAFP